MLHRLDAEEEPENPDYPEPPRFRTKLGSRGVIWASADGEIEDMHVRSMPKASLRAPADGLLLDRTGHRKGQRCEHDSMMTRTFTLLAFWAATCGAALAQPQAPNPASQRCIDEGGTLQIEQRPDGGQFGVCVFTDNRQCEEWALFRVECPVGGLRVTGYLTPATRYCAITGGNVNDNDCLLPGGKSCDVDAYFAGACTR